MSEKIENLDQSRQHFDADTIERLKQYYNVEESEIIRFADKHSKIGRFGKLSVNKTSQQ